MKTTIYNKVYEKEVQEIFKLYWNDPEFLQELDEALESESCKFYIIKNDAEVLGVAGIRKADNFLKDYTSTNNPVELYIIASKNKGKGIGNILLKHIVNECKRENYTEIICYSPETHNGSWRFYEKNGFIKYGIVNDPDDGCPGMVYIHKINIL